MLILKVIINMAYNSNEMEGLGYFGTRQRLMESSPKNKTVWHVCGMWQGMVIIDVLLQQAEKG